MKTKKETRKEEQQDTLPQGKTISAGGQQLNVGQYRAAGRSIADIAETLRSIKTKFGDEAMMMLGDQQKVDVDVISTGSIGLDDALGIGGLPRGRVVEAPRLPRPVLRYPWYRIIPCELARLRLTWKSAPAML